MRPTNVVLEEATGVLMATGQSVLIWTGAEESAQIMEPELRNTDGAAVSARAAPEEMLTPEAERAGCGPAAQSGQAAQRHKPSAI
ncbi:MAG: hypothetical protein GX410_02790 [Elusimicrobia bacterium]|nr:hypothetical protein [Elusimicrobiota bacterium]